MNESGSFNLTLNQRYFHLVTLADTGGYQLTDYWKQVSNTNFVSKSDSQLPSGNAQIEHRKYKTDVAYPHGELLKVISLSKREEPPYLPPYLYDIFALRMKFQSKTYFAFAFPFLALGRDIMNRLVASHGLLRQCDFLKVNLLSLINLADSLSTSGKTRIRVKGMRVIINEDPAVSSIVLEGDDPMRSTIYAKYLQDSIRRGSPIEQCTILCEPQAVTALEPQTLSETKKLRVQMRMHTVGAFKFYIHIKAENMATVPLIIERLVSLKCLDTASGNPFNRVREEDI